MKVIVPREITPARIKATSLPARHASEPEEYDPARTYIADQQCMVAATDRIYQSLTAGNVGHYPPDSPGHWVAVGATNRGRWNDEYVNTFSEDLEGLGYIEKDLESALTTSVALFGVRGTSVDFTLLDAAGAVVAERSIDLMVDDCLDWYDVCFTEPELGDRVYWQYPFTAAGTLRIRINLPGGGARLGDVRYGMERVLGQTLLPVNPGILDFSEKTTDEKGRTRIAQGLYADLLDFSLVLPTGAVDKVRRILTTLRGRACVWMVDNLTDDQDTLEGSLLTYFVLGYYSSLTISVAWDAEYKLSIEGVV
ncbi:hypothetical protein G3N56_11295 [Desulfovibrio sulfodismutans]|uniref:Uncharacterized protein n=1 Tax=Desulfolutivibrio sulfodismutans TaxID=63561 RepID=A0A7K3NMH8_9BACT|nr:hypothetical protein [Desulfolutivibrio sulfodismutans]NDY57327.1 hypothetical protein [Desulfolutivibrio sulfodismutans]QLA11878.1 hypothetical protein GD606_06190 [Desulfolutivibrio sulfodismutans DSM 3696]